MGKLRQSLGEGGSPARGSGGQKHRVTGFYTTIVSNHGTLPVSFQGECDLTVLICTDLLLVGLLSLVVNLLYSRCMQGFQRDLEALHLSPINDHQSGSKSDWLELVYQNGGRYKFYYFIRWAHSNGLIKAAVKHSSKKSMENSRLTVLWWTGLVILLLQCSLASASLIASSEIQMCQRTSAAFEPMFGTGEACRKKFVVSMAVKSGQVSHPTYYQYTRIQLLSDYTCALIFNSAPNCIQGESNAIYANIKFVDNHTSVVHRKEQMKKPFRISVTKSDVLVNYPLRYHGVSCYGAFFIVVISMHLFFIIVGQQ